MTKKAIEATKVLAAASILPALAFVLFAAPAHAGFGDVISVKVSNTNDATVTNTVDSSVSTGGNRANGGAGGDGADGGENDSTAGDGGDGGEGAEGGEGGDGGEAGQGGRGGDAFDGDLAVGGDGGTGGF
ncbi:hypothetical protein GVX82_00715, partial [Patescibacteria group bacterium]|nr:hypothetical protein [Patescibacteria group bacterium]